MGVGELQKSKKKKKSFCRIINNFVCMALCPFWKHLTHFTQIIHPSYQHNTHFILLWWCWWWWSTTNWNQKSHIFPSKPHFPYFFLLYFQITIIIAIFIAAHCWSAAITDAAIRHIREWILSRGHFSQPHTICNTKKKKVLDFEKWITNFCTKKNLKNYIKLLNQCQNLWIKFPMYTYRTLIHRWLKILLT